MQEQASSTDSAKARAYVGIDVCKDWLDVFIHPFGQTFRVSNCRTCLRKLKRVLAGHDVALIAMEATSKFHRQAHRTLHAADFAVLVVNPRRVRLFAEASGVLAKTDTIDARILAAFGECLRLPATQPLPSELEELQELWRGRAATVRQQTALTNQRGAAQSRILIRELDRQQRIIATTIARLEAAIAHIIAQHPILARRFEILTSIPGIGQVGAWALIAGISEIGTLTSRAVAMIAGLAPVACDSAERRGQRHIRGGRADVRSALYMAAHSAARHNPDLKPFYERLRANGKKPKVALTAVMRKLTVLANTLIREDRLWSPTYA